MPNDITYTSLNYSLSEIEHKYGKRVHILENPFLQSILAKLSRPETIQPLLNQYIAFLYRHLFAHAVNTCFPREVINWDTRMIDVTDRGVFKGEIIKRDQHAVVVNLARAGTYPSHICYDELNYLVDPQWVRQDHFYINRKTDEQNKVVGVDVSGSKIGGGVENAMVLFPDPMGATGGSLSYCINHYKDRVQGTAARYIALHIIVTPEYIQRMQKDHPDVEIFSIRLDRGLSDAEILQSIPGTYPERERGLTDNQYIVPGAGGVGEILNNSFV